MLCACLVNAVSCLFVKCSLCNCLVSLFCLFGESLLVNLHVYIYFIKFLVLCVVMLICLVFFCVLSI